MEVAGVRRHARLAGMAWTPRWIEPDELPAVIDLLSLGFGVGPVSPPDHRAEVTSVAEVGRTFAVTDEGRIVATAAAHSLHLALPGGAVPMAGVTEVVVSPTHRRRGLLSALLEAVHDQAVERGEPLAGLTASEGGIYRRFGYGVAARFQSVRVDAYRSAEVEALDGPGPGGFITYRIAQDWGAGGTSHEARVLQVAAGSDAVEAALVRFVLDIDLVGSLTWNAPVDVPLRGGRAAPRALAVRAEGDQRGRRPLDVAACLAARTYAAAGE